MNPEQLKADEVLSDLSTLVKSGQVSREQVLSIVGEKPAQSSSVKQTPAQRINLQRIMYYIGGFIVLLGIVIFIAQFWDSMSQVSRTAVALVSALSAYSLGYYFFANTPSKDFGHAFFVISAALFPLGVGTALDTLGVSATTPEGASVNAALLFIIFFASYWSLKAAIFLPFSIIAASTFYFTFTLFLFKTVQPIPHFSEYQILALGVAYLSIGYYFSITKQGFMTGLLYFFGLLMVLGTAMILQGFSPKINVFWQLIYPFLLVATFWASIKLQDRLFLIIATLFTFGQILKFTSEYFSKSIGWPISLIVSGLVIMGIGYMSFELNKRYLRVKPSP